MAVISWKDAGGSVVGTSYASINATQAVTVSGSSLTYTPPAVQVKHNFGFTSTQRYKLTSYLYQGSSYMDSLDTKTSSYVSNNTYVSVAWNNTVTINTSTLFKASNKTSRTVSLLLRPYVLEIYDKQDYIYSYAASNKLLTTVTVTLDVPPTATVSAVSFDTPYVYAGLTTASVTVSNAAAYYRGDVTDVTLTIGSQTASISGNGTLSIPLNVGGNFTPTVTITDSRGQVNEYQLDPITVGIYSTPTVNFDAQRTDVNGKIADEGAYATIVTTLTFDPIAEAVAPTVAVADEDGNAQTIDSITWYSSRASDGTLSGAVTWSTLASGSTVYGLISITGDFDTQKSYVISLTPQDSEGITGDTKTDTLQTAFYTVDFLAGGHGIAFGKPAVNVGFECGMDATFDETLTAQDMTAQEVQDFVDGVGGGTGAFADKVIEQGASGIWTYRKWASGIAECWGTVSWTITSWTSWSGWYYSTISARQNYPTSLFLSTPSLMIGGRTSSGDTVTGTQSYHSQTQTPGFVFYRPATGSNNITGYVDMHAIGKWK